MRSVVLLDGNNTFYRADSVTDLHDSSGNRVSGIYGTLRIIRSLIERFKPTDLIVVWDGGRSPERNAFYTEYKKKPKAQIEDAEAAEHSKQEFYNQVQDLYNNLPLFGVRQIKLPKTEADDVIAALTTELAQDVQPIIVSSDKDFFQLLQVDPKVLVYSPVKNIVYDRAVFEKEYGFTADRMLEFKALIGDGSDNIPGILGIGDKTAKTLISRSPSLSQLILDEGDSLMKSKKLAKLVEEYESTVVRNMKLMDLMNPLVTSREDLILGSLTAYLESRALPIEHSKVQRYLVSHNFSSIIKDYNSWISEFDLQVVRSRMGEE